MYKKTKSLLIYLAGICTVIIAHEFGHFIFCNLFGVHTPIFSVGFGPQIFGITIGTTIFQLALFPFGGYVAIDPVSLAPISYLEKFIINIAGIAFNILFALLLFLWISYKHSAYKKIPIIGSIQANSPAAQAGMAANDKILAINNIALNYGATDFIEPLKNSHGKEIMVTIERNGTVHTLSVHVNNIRPPAETLPVGLHGITFKTVKTKLDLIQTSTNAVHYTWAALHQMVRALLLAFSPTRTHLFYGPIGSIIQGIKYQQLGIDSFILWLALININVAVFNLIPLPMLDGGHIMIDAMEYMYGQQMPARILIWINLTTILSFTALLVYLTKRDIHMLKKKENT